MADPQHANAFVTNALLMTILKKLQVMDERAMKIDHKVTQHKVVFMASDALRLYRKHLEKGVSRRGTPFRKPENYSYLLDRFEEVFGRRNIAMLTTEQCTVFLNHYWSAPGTIIQRRNELSAFFTWCIRYLQKQGKPTFVNPCVLMDPIHHVVQKPTFIETPKMRKVLDSAVDDRQWLIFAIMATGGLRVSEVLKLTKARVQGQVLQLVLPKSGAEEEFAVIPKKVARKLAAYAKDFTQNEPLFALCRSGVFKSLKARGQGPHKLRKWCITFWDRANDPGMEHFVRRHSSKADPLRPRYVAPLTPKEAIKKISRLERELWK